MAKVIWFIVLSILQSLLAARDFILHPSSIAAINLKKTSDATPLSMCVDNFDQFIYVAGAKGGLFIIDLANPESPVPVGHIQTDHASHCQINDNNLFIADQFQGFFIYDVTDKSAPKQIAQVSAPANSLQYLIVNKATTLLFILSKGYVLTYSLADMKAPQLISMIGVGAPNSYRIRFDAKEEYIIVSNHIMGLQIIDIRDVFHQQIRVNKNPAFVIWDGMFTFDNKAIYITDAYYGMFYADPTQLFTYPIGSTVIYDLPFVNVFQTSVLTLCLAMTSEGEYLFLGLRSLGLFLFNIKSQDYAHPIFVQHLSGSYLNTQIVLSKQQERYAYSVDGIQFLIYKSVSPSLNQDYPNLLNSFQSSLIQSNNQLPPIQALCLGNDYLIVSDQQTAVLMYSIDEPYYPKQIATIPKNSLGSFSDISMTSDKKTLFISSSGTGLQVYDISTISSPSPLSENYHPYPVNQVVSSNVNAANNMLVVANSFYGVFLLDVTNPSSISGLQSYTVMQACGFERCVIMKDSIRVLCSCREVGVFFFKIEGDKLVNTSTFKEIGSEQPLLSADESTMFVASGFQGIFIVDIRDFNNPIELSQLILSGQAQRLRLVYDEKYLIVSEVDKGQITLINIENLQNPYVQQKVQFQYESSTSLCVLDNFQGIYFLGSMGIRYIPIRPDIKMHTQIQVQILDEEGNFLYYHTLDEGTPLKVGQVAYFTFSPLFTEQKITINAVKYYRYFLFQDLPTWMTFLPETGQVFMTVNKLGVNNDFSTEENGENILVLELLIQITPTSFVLNTLIDSTLSAHILSTLRVQGYVNSIGQLTSKFDPQVSFYLDFYDTTYTTALYSDPEIQKHIKKVLVYSKVQYPIRFFIKSSLIFDYGASNSRTLSTATQVIQTPSTQVTIFLQLLKNGIFVKKIFEGVLASFSDDLSSVQISGQTSYVNLIVGSQLQISNKTANLEDVTIYTLIKDSSNYDFSKTLTLKDLKYFTTHKDIYIDPSKSLQSQLEIYYKNSDLSVESQFSFSFSSSTFIQPDSLPMTYTAYFVNSDGTEKQIQNGDWISFSSISLSFSGIRTVSFLYSSATIKLKATDGYSSTSSTFKLNFNSVPFLFVIQIIVAVIGPLVGILGIWKYRHEIHLFVAERGNMYQDEYANIGKLYKKQIILMDQLQNDSLKLWKLFEKHDKNLHSKILQEYQKNGFIDMEEMMKNLETVYSSADFPSIDPREFDFNDSRLLRLIKRQVYSVILHQNQDTAKALEFLKSYSLKTHKKKDWYKMYIQITPIMEIINNKVIRTEPLKQVKGALNQIENTQENKSKNLLMVEEEQEGVQLRKVESVQKKDPRMQTVWQTEQIQLSATNSPARTPQVLSFGKQVSMLADSQYLDQNYQAEEIRPQYDWQQQQYQDLNPFPEMTINKQKIEVTLKKNKHHQLRYDLNLLSEIILLEASGIADHSPSSLNPAVGESLHVASYQLLQIQAFQKNQGEFGQKIFDFLNMSYKPMGLNANNPLPSWLNYQIADGIINIWGVPNPSDEAEILIRIINNLLFTVYSFRIIIQDQEGNDCRDKRLLRSVTTKLNQNQSHKQTKVHFNNLSQNLNNAHGETNAVPKVIDVELENTQNQLPNPIKSQFFSDCCIEKPDQINSKSQRNLIQFDGSENGTSSREIGSEKINIDGEQMFNNIPNINNKNINQNQLNSSQIILDIGQPPSYLVRNDKSDEEAEHVKIQAFQENQIK